MNDLIEIKYENDHPTVDARDLHAKLGIKTHYKDWIKRIIDQMGFDIYDQKCCCSKMSGENFRHGAHNRVDHFIATDMAKQICMLQRTEIGKKFREYFISIENAWNSPEKIMERAMQIAHQRAVEAERRILGLKEDNEILKISLNESLKYYTIAKYNKCFHKKWDIEKCRKIGKELSIYCNKRGIAIRKCETNDERFGSVNSYQLDVLEDFLESRDVDYFN